VGIVPAHGCPRKEGWLRLGNLPHAHGLKSHTADPFRRLARNNLRFPEETERSNVVVSPIAMLETSARVLQSSSNARGKRMHLKCGVTLCTVQFALII
jgi:hypothetical protein